MDFHPYGNGESSELVLVLLWIGPERICLFFFSPPLNNKHKQSIYLLSFLLQEKAILTARTENIPTRKGCPEIYSELNYHK